MKYIAAPRAGAALAAVTQAESTLEVKGQGRARFKAVEALAERELY